MSLLSSMIGILLILGGIVIPGETWIGFFRPMPPSPMREQLLFGSMLFRAALAAVGIGLFVLPYLPFWRRPPVPHPKPRPEGQSPAALACILGILACALVLRLYKLELG